MDEVAIWRGREVSLGAAGDKRREEGSDCGRHTDVKQQSAIELLVDNVLGEHLVVEGLRF